MLGYKLQAKHYTLANLLHSALIMFPLLQYVVLDIFLIIKYIRRLRKINKSIAFISMTTNDS